MRKIFILICLTAAVNAYSQTDTVPTFVRDSLDAYVNRALTEWNIPGVSVCVIKNEKVVTMKGYGVTELGTDHGVDENTLFMIGSNTKAFTATALAILDAEKKLSLNARVTKWIPEFKSGTELAGEQAIIRGLVRLRIPPIGF